MDTPPEPAPTTRYVARFTLVEEQLHVDTNGYPRWIVTRDMATVQADGDAPAEALKIVYRQIEELGKHHEHKATTLVILGSAIRGEPR